MRIPIPEALLLALLATAAVAAPPPPLAVERAWARATPPGIPVAAVYLTIDNRSDRAVSLVGVSSPRAARGEVHTIVHEANVARMRPIDALQVAPGARLVLEPGGMHLMLLGLTAPLEPGQRVPLRLEFDGADAIEVEAVVLPAVDYGP